jgi:hypothetical protein
MPEGEERNPKGGLTSIALEQKLDYILFAKENPDK